ncbi:MAG: 4Fe-4S dicluster domain-containing protein [Rikenellaceae bacterium]|nr:4Fe-4S dicluster domain-containing protein [Rikenellaceae bacterium]
MGKYFELLSEDIRFVEGLKACMNCGVCTAICPAAEFYCYDPRRIVDRVQTRDDAVIEELLKSETIWYCGQCMSCKPRCPRGNTPGAVIQALRTLSQRLGFFVHSEKGRQQIALKRVIGHNILETGYCIFPKTVNPDLHPEQGPVWRWIYEHDKEVFGRFTENYQKAGAGPVRKIAPDNVEEINRIFEVTGGKAFFETIEKYSDEAARQMGMDGAGDAYFNHVYAYNNGNHTLNDE